MPTATRLDSSRPAIIAAIAVLVLGLTYFVTKPGDNGASVSSSTSTPPAQTSTTATTATGTTSTTATTTTPAKPAQPALQPGPGLPADVARALNRGQVVVLFFYEPAASDDQATKAAIRAVRQAAPTRAVRLFQDVVARISDYRRVVGSLGISQTPAMVVVDRSRHAELLQGYLDAGTIRQTVRDAI